jgi:hypothetical protein
VPLLRRHPERVPAMFLSPAAAPAWSFALAGFAEPLAALAGIRALRLHSVLSRYVPCAAARAARLSAEVTVHEAPDLGRAVAGPWSVFAVVAVCALRDRRLVRRDRGLVRRDRGLVRRDRGLVRRDRGLVRRDRGLVRRDRGLVRRDRAVARRDRAVARRDRGLVRRLAALAVGMAVHDWLEDRPDLGPLTYGALRLVDETARGAGIWIGCLRERDFRGLRSRRPTRR